MKRTANIASTRSTKKPTAALAPLRVGVAERCDIEQRGYLDAEENSRLHISRLESLVRVGWILSVGACLPVGPGLVDERAMQPEQWISRRCPAGHVTADCTMGARIDGAFEQGLESIEGSGERFHCGQ